jgi:histidinol-phosphate phosphatase family protein
MLDFSKIDKSWTLFLDRDGVINHEKHNDYVYNYEEFIFYEGVQEALKIATERFGKLLVATNQRGVGRGLMTEEDLVFIHEKMIDELAGNGAVIKKIYYCISIDNADHFRKPNPGMAEQAKKDFPDIDFSKSIMIGNNISDMEFGRNAGMHTIFLTTTHPEPITPGGSIDRVFDSLIDFAKALQLS